MSKYKIPNKDSSLNPYQERDILTGRNLMTVTPRDSQLGASQSFLEDASTLEVDPGQSLYGNSGFAGQVINERKAHDQGALELLGKGLFNVAKTIGIEAAKIPGYLTGTVGAIGNELFEDGKDSMSMIVDNAWVNAFEKLDDSAKALMPVYMSKQVQEGNLLDKIGSGAWWAESGAEGLGFMLSMFLPGAVAKAAKVGAGIAKLGEGLGNLAPTLGRYATGLGLLEDAGEAGFKYTAAFAKNANGVASATLNTVLEASAEAANTFDNLKSKYLEQGLSETESKAKAGEGAAAVFKGNMALLFISNLIDEKWLWKSIGSGEKEAAQSILSRVTKDGVIDWDMLKQIPKEFTKGEVIKKSLLDFGKGILKEGIYEEGSQTTLQQNIEKGDIGKNFLHDLYNVGASYFDDFANNKELHESIFLGGLLGGGASVIATVQENKALQEALTGSSGRSADNFWVKYGMLSETKPQKGLLNLIKENHINQFRSYKDFLEDDGKGNKVLNEKKLIDSQLQGITNLRTDVMYDIAVQDGDKLSQEILGQFLAANYAQTFLGQEGGKELFNQHVDEQVLPAWKKRFEETFGREATAKEQSDYTERFKKSGERVLNAFNQAQETNYPERYFKEDSKLYSDFKDHYAHQKFQTLVARDAINERKSQIKQNLLSSGVNESDLEDLKSINDPVTRLAAAEAKSELAEIAESEKQLNESWPKFFTKEGVKQMYDAFSSNMKEFETLVQEAKKQNEELKKKVNDLPSKNEAELQRILDVNKNYRSSDVINLKDKTGKSFQILRDPESGDYLIAFKQGLVPISEYTGDLESLGLIHDDVTTEEFNNFKDTGKASEPVLNRIAKKLNNNEDLTDDERTILAANSDDILKQQEKLKAPIKPVSAPVLEVAEDSNIDKTIDDLNKDKGVNMFPSTGRNLKSEFVELDGMFIEPMTDKPSQKLWFDVLDKEVIHNPKAYTVKVVRKDDKSNIDLWNQIDRDAGSNSTPGDLYIVLHRDGKPIIKDGNYVFTGLWKPQNLYPITANGKPKEFILAEHAVMDNFKFHIGLPELNVDRLSAKDKQRLKSLGIEPTAEAIIEAAFFHGKNEYATWYRSLQDTPGELQMEGVTKGHAVKMYKDKTGKEPMWFKPLGNIPNLNLKISPNPKVNDLQGGKFKLAVEGVITVEGKEIKMSQGDLIIVDLENNLHPMKSRNINEQELRTILYLLSLRADTNQPTETIKVKPTKPMRFGINDMSEVPVFFNANEKKVKGGTRKNIIETLIAFGKKDQNKKGEIYFSEESILTNDPVLIWTDFNDVNHSIQVKTIKDAVDNNDLNNESLKELNEFLAQKRFNVNEHLLGSSDKVGNPIFSKPNLVYKRDQTGKSVPELEWDQTRSYYDHLLNDVLTTTTKTLKGYPNRVQRNAWFSKAPIQDLSEFSEISEPETIEPVEPKPTTKRARKEVAPMDDFMDKILTTSDLLKYKLQSGEITQNCK